MATVRVTAESRVAIAGLINNLPVLLGLSAEHLLLEPNDLGPEGLKLPGQLCDLSLLITNDLFEFLSFGSGDRLALNGPGVHRLPVMGLPAEFDRQDTRFGTGDRYAARLGILNEHAAMLPGPGMCVQQGTNDPCRPP